MGKTYINCLLYFCNCMYLYNKMISVPVHVIVRDPLSTEVCSIYDIHCSYVSLFLQSTNQVLISQ